MKSILFFGIIAVMSTSAFAVDSRKCSSMLNNGLWKKYKYGGVGESNINAMTQGTKRDGSSTASSDMSTEGTTAISDPKYTSNVSTSQTQSLSSWGECSAFAKTKEMRKDREIYVAQNETEVLIDVARGDGEHLKVLTFYSACSPEAYKELSAKLQKSVGESETMPDSKSICASIDRIISQSSDLKSKCASI